MKRRIKIKIDVSMPHAALWVVQPETPAVPVSQNGFQCRTRLCGWCNDVSSIEWIYQSKFQCRTRLCGWCNVRQFYVCDNSCTFQCRTRLCGWCNENAPDNPVPNKGFNAARGFVGGATINGALVEMRVRVSMPHAALWVVQLLSRGYQQSILTFQCRTRLCGWCNPKEAREFIKAVVSMPHAALWVVQLPVIKGVSQWDWRFQCRTRLCGWCNVVSLNGEPII